MSVIIISGKQGSGKTTWINNILKKSGGKSFLLPIAMEDIIANKIIAIDGVSRKEDVTKLIRYSHRYPQKTFLIAVQWAFLDLSDWGNESGNIRFITIKRKG